MPKDNEEDEMTLLYSLDSKDAFDKLDTTLQPLYKPQENGSYLLDVDGAIPKAKADELQIQLEDAKKALVGPEGKTYQEMFNGSQTANAKIRQERDALDTELKSWKSFGTVEDVKKIKDELDGYKAKGAKLDEAQQEIISLKQAKRELEEKVNGLATAKTDLEKTNKELVDYKTNAERAADRYDAEQKIAAVVEAIPEANQKALKRNLIDRYKDGDLIRDGKGNLVSKDDAMTLPQFAKEQMEAYGLYRRSEPGHNVGDGNKPSVKPEGSGYADIASLLK